MVPNSDVVCLLDVKHSFVRISPSQYILSLHGPYASSVHFLLEGLPILHLNLGSLVKEIPTSPSINDLLLLEVVNMYPANYPR